MELILTRNYGLSSLLIRARLSFSKKRIEPWSHAIFGLPGGEDCIDSTFKLGGVRRRPLKEALKGCFSWQVKRLPLVLPYPQAALVEVGRLEGKPYDLRNAFGWAVGSRDWDDTSAEYCFEVLARIIEAGSDYRFPSLQRVSGRDLEQAALALVSASEASQ